VDDALQVFLNFRVQVYECYVRLIEDQLAQRKSTQNAVVGNKNLKDRILLVMPNMYLMTEIFQGNNPKLKFQRFLKKKSADHKKVLFAPVFVEATKHFVLYIIYKEDKNIYFYDSLRRVYKDNHEHVLRYVSN
jgi:hypothetical protein